MARWDPWQEFEALRREIDRAFASAGLRVPSLFRTAFLPAEGPREYPLVNVHEDKDTVYVEALAPGLDPASLKLSVLGSTLTLSGEKQRAAADVKREAFHREERSAGRFTRRIELPVEFDEANVKAEYTDGLLLVTLPKAPKAKPREISVQVG